MNTVQYGNKTKSMFDNKTKYIMHYQIMEEYDKDKTSLFKWNLFLFIGFYLFLRDYPTLLASLDFSFTVLAVLYLLVFKPLMLKGKIPAYYRRDYGKLKPLYKFLKLFIKGGVIRFMILSLYYAITFYLVQDNAYKVVEYQSMALDIIESPTSWLVATISSLVVIYVLFYHERYVSIQEYSIRVSDIFANTNLTEKGAVNEFVFQKDRELEILHANGVKYKENESSTYVKETTAHTKTSEVVVNETKETVNTGIFEDEKEEPDELIRRRARR